MGFGAGAGLREARDERRWGGDRVVALAAHLAKVCDLPVREALAVGLSAIQKSGDTGSSEQRVVLGLERGELVSTNIRASARHHHCGIPSEQGQRTAERVETAELLLELFVRRG